ncbi:MAG: bifunctional oligoribonuclease/PAP phosphatase NrnA [Bacteroidales bacterium]|nr:bifunctional oligoribonuclease/PAP phosphatase NrnA [Bacteroidales bacterium]
MSSIENSDGIKGFEKLQSLISASFGKIVIITHFNPDGDAIGSTLGLQMSLKKAGHTCHVIVPNDFPDFLKWLPGADEIITLPGNEEKIIQHIQSSDILFFVDFNDVRRMKGINEPVTQSQAFKVLIDHHPDPVVEVDCMLSDTNVSSSAELVYRFLQKTTLKDHMDREIALCLFVGIMTDTGCFSYNSSSPDTYFIVADLLCYGIDKDKIYYRIYDSFSSDRMRLLGFCLDKRMEYYPSHRTAMIWLSQKDQEKYNFQIGDSEGFVNYPLSIRGVRFSAFFIEKEDHVKVSFRSKGAFPVNTFSARHFNGGGHRNASGGEIYESLETALDLFRDLLPKYHDELIDYDE